jgi:hypothetical protein
MVDDLAILHKLTQMSATGKMKDSKEVLKGKEIPRRKKGKKKALEDPAEGRPEAETEGEGKEANPPSGRVVDIIV